MSQNNLTELDLTKLQLSRERAQHTATLVAYHQSALDQAKAASLSIEQTNRVFFAQLQEVYKLQPADEITPDGTIIRADQKKES